MSGLKTGVENYIFWSEIVSGLENRAAHPHQVLPGVPPGVLCKPESVQVLLFFLAEEQ